jgi:hypothetical protein
MELDSNHLAFSLTTKKETKIGYECLVLQALHDNKLFTVKYLPTIDFEQCPHLKQFIL